MVMLIHYTRLQMWVIVYISLFSFLYLIVMCFSFTVLHLYFLFRNGLFKQAFPFAFFNFAFVIRNGLFMAEAGLFHLPLSISLLYDCC